MTAPSPALAGLLAQADAGYGLSIGGWVTMLASVGFVTGLLTWCIWKVVTSPGEADHLHAQTDIDPGDHED